MMEPLFRYCFGKTVYDEATCELVVDGLPVELQTKPLVLLSMLLAAGGEVVSRETLLQTLWEGRYRAGESNVLPNAVAKLRAALGGDAEAIETVPRRGYRFAASAERTLVGRSFESDLALAAGAPVPLRDGVVLVRLLAHKPGQEVWLAQRADGVHRVFKFASNSARIADLRREARLSRLLATQLGGRDDIVPVLSWSFAQPPCFIELAFGGVRLDEWALRDAGLARLTLTERIALFVSIATPVSASHRVPVFHKDLKPSNILVDDADGTRAVRLTDFGSGGLAEPERRGLLGLDALTATLDAVSADDLIQSSFPYLAPEMFDVAAASAQSDVYALGVILYQLVVGDLTKPLAPGWERAIGDDDLRDDIRHATDGDPGRRFASVDALIDALRRLGERRAARLREAAEREQIARDRAALARDRARRPWVVAMFAIVVAAFGVSLYFYVGARSAQDASSRLARMASDLNRFLTDDLIAQADPTVAGRADVTVVQAASQAAAKIDTVAVTTDPAVRARLHHAMQRAFNGLGDRRASVEEGTLALKALGTQAHADPDTEIRTRALLAIGLSDLGRREDAAAQVAAARARFDATGRRDAALAVEVRYAEGYLLVSRYALDEGLQAYREAWSLASQVPDLAPDLRDRVLLVLADTERMTHRGAEAERHMRQLLVEQTARLGPVDPRPCYTTVALALVLGNETHLDEAMAAIRPAIACLDQRMGPGARRTLKAIDVLGQLQFQRGDYLGAATTWTGIAGRVEALGDDGAAWTLRLLTDIPLAYRLSGDVGAATPAFSRALEVARRHQPNDAPQVQRLRFWLADCRLTLAQVAGVGELLDGLTADALQRAQLQDDWDGRLAYERGRLALAQGQRALARAHLAEAVEMFTVHHSADAFTAQRAKAVMKDAGL